MTPSPSLTPPHPLQEAPSHSPSIAFQQRFSSVSIVLLPLPLQEALLHSEMAGVACAVTRLMSAEADAKRVPLVEGPLFESRLDMEQAASTVFHILISTTF